MLGKQGWRLMNNQDSLVSRIYKARYYPNCSFLGASLGRNPRFVWRSIWEAKPLLMSGTRWCVGSGRNIEILRQPWLVDVHNSYITSDLDYLNGSTVHSLMRTDSRTWDEDIIADLFNERDQRCILNVQISYSRDEDSLYWNNEVSGNYTVRSAYKLLQMQKGNWDESNNGSIWKKLWKIKVPSKALNLCWRALSDNLPTLCQLQKRHVPVNNVCPVCKTYEETVYHALVSCHFASQCWEKVLSRSFRTNVSNYMEWFTETFNSCSKEKRCEIVMMSWGIWKAQNETVWQQKNPQANNVYASTMQYLVHWKNAQAVTHIAQFPNIYERDGAVNWVKPQMDTIKVTVDAALFEDVSAFGFGLAARDDTGDLIQARTVRREGVVTPVMAEALAIKEALSWTDHKSWPKIVIESDCLVIIQAIRSKIAMVYMSQVGMIVEECRTLLSSKNNVKLLFIKRSANMVAHSLAKASYSISDRVFNRRDVPTEVESCIVNDLNMQ